jgi:hypothetical protein
MMTLPTFMPIRYQIHDLKNLVGKFKRIQHILKMINDGLIKCTQPIHFLLHGCQMFLLFGV